ncbi:MAG: hypothetical protein IPI13_17675 [Actinomycetales bacterium]|uniref:Uncharacterized protein n=1 Tax=Candidatus Phosphoribacter hodrii TaxID=2953743 RepID=A0A935M6X5_9MICO|nr:hypothetical protein [Candidatus Phosphoribacter hodrii]
MAAIQTVDANVKQAAVAAIRAWRHTRDSDPAAKARGRGLPGSRPTRPAGQPRARHSGVRPALKLDHR